MASAHFRCLVFVLTAVLSDERATVLFGVPPKDAYSLWYVISAVIKIIDYVLFPFTGFRLPVSKV